MRQARTPGLRRGWTGVPRDPWEQPDTEQGAPDQEAPDERSNDCITNDASLIADLFIQILKQLTQDYS